MRILLRCLLWTLIALLPLRGTGAMPFMACGAAPVAVQPAASHCAQQAAAAAHATHHGHSGSQHDGHTSDDSGCCSACVVPPATLSLRQPAKCSSAPVRSAEPAMTAYIAATPERPPRHLA